jgi:hypothetical protein
MKIEELEIDIGNMLAALHLQYKQASIGSYLPNIFLIDDFGIIVAGIEAKDYTQMLSKLTSTYEGYKFFFIVTSDSMLEKKEEFIWELMRCGYIRHIRKSYSRQFNNLILSGFGRKVIKERLRLWDDKPQYKYLIEENELALKTPETYLLSADPAFFDFMPENNIGETNV